MKKLLCLLIYLFLISVGAGAANSASVNPKDAAGINKITLQSILSEMQKGTYAQGELLVKFKAGTDISSSLSVHNAVGASVVKRYTVMSNLEYVRLPQGLSVRDAIVRYMSDPNVEYAAPNYIRHVASVPRVVPNDTYFGNQWALYNRGKYAYGTKGADINAVQAWNISVGDPSIVIAVLDTGIDYGHADLAGNIWGSAVCNGLPQTPDDKCIGWDFTTCAKFDLNNVDENGNPICLVPKAPGNDPMDDNGHGTHVSGIIGAVGYNGYGISGVMWDVQLMGLKVLNADGEGWDADIIDALEYVITMKQNGVNIVAINASWGGEGNDQDLRDAIAQTGTVGIIFVAAAGNGGAAGVGNNNDITPFYPASYNLPNIISVAATDQDDRRVPFSNFGLNSVHVAAPGVYIWSTVPTWWSEFFGFGILDFMEGTSMAAPHVTGLAGLLSSYYTSFPYSSIREMILRYVDEKPTLAGWISTGGRINAYKAMSSLWSPGNFVGKSTNSKINLKWIRRATDADGYILERSLNGVNFSLLATLPAKAKSYSDKGLDPGTTYFYRLRAFNDIGESPTVETSVVTHIKPTVPPAGAGSE